MAISRALMNRQLYNMGGPSQPRQMYDMGGSSLQAGAPDLRLTGDVRPTYTQGRKNRMDMAFGGIAGLDGRKRYGIGSWFQENIMDPIKDNPVTSAVIGGGLLNQFGIPKSVADYLGTGTGQNFLGELVSKIPGVPVLDTVFGEGNRGDMGYNLNELIFGMPGTQGEYGIGTGVDYEGDAYGTTSAADEIKKLLMQQGTGGGNQGNQPTNLQSPEAQDKLELEKYKRRNLNMDLAKALGIGTAAGAYVDSQPKDVLPTDTTGINFQTAQQVLDDPNQRFKPPVEATQLAAEGGRIGYNMGGDVDTLVASYMKSPEGQQELMSKANEGMGMPEIVDQMKQELMMAQASSQENMPMQQPNRMMAAEGGLMDLGGMEKDYREDGGFVPIGGKEKADDVPARLSKNEFVFTADAVRNAGGGDIDEGAQVMERLMKSLEQGGEVSEESQGLDGAREMFETSQRLEKRII